MTLESINPATGKTVSSHSIMTESKLAKIIEDAASAQPEWARRSFGDRADALRRCGELLRERKQVLAELMANEMGKRVVDGQGEVEKCAWVCDYYADHAEAFLTPEMVETDARRSFVAFEPLGVVLAIMPWNFPFWQVFRFAAPALMAGNAGILKHASNVSGCALAIEDALHEAGVPRKLFRTVLLPGRDVGDLIDHPGIAAVTLTGSTPAGRAVASRAGAALKKTVLELGGSDPYVVLADADLEAAIETCVTSRLINVGQSCIAGKRFILPQEHRARCVELFVEKMWSKTTGDPLSREVDLGPMARSDLRDELHGQVVKSVQRGARCLAGGEIPSGPGCFYPPTVLTDVAPGMPAYDDELFGPVASLIFVSSEEEAIRVANDTGFGLGAAVFTADVERGERIAHKELQAGACFVNAFVRSDPRLPFGGIKLSGYGRELSHFGIREFVNIKAVYVA